MRNNLWKMDYFYTYFLFFSDCLTENAENGPREMAKRTSEMLFK